MEEAAAMSGWISSKLKVAETFLQQIDQQAAESLGKNEKPQSPSASESNNGNEIPKKIDSATPLKYQLPKKSPTPPSTPSTLPPPIPPAPDITTTQQSLPPLSSSKPPDPAVIDWTELLSSPNPAIPLSSPSDSKIKKNNKKPLIPAAPVFDKKERVEGEKKLLEEIQHKNKDGDEKANDVSAADVTARSDLVHDDDDSSGSSSGSEDSGTNSEDERQRNEERRKKKEQMIAEKAAAAAAKAIKDREDVVARLEGEKQSLEKILEEREKQQAQEASELQMNMIETMEAVELEKQKHNSTRMEAFARLAKLETTNAELARSLAASQWNLEVEVNRISELRQKIDLKELTQEEHKRRVQKIRQKRSSPGKEELLRKDELEQEILDAEHYFICNKISQLKDKAKMLEENIESTKRGRVYPSEVEVELRKRLTQLTDHLIQKQTQVEALSSEKATLMLRTEMISRLLDENGSSLQATDVSNEVGLFPSSAATPSWFDIEAAAWQRPSKSEILHERLRSGRQQLGSLVQQLDIVFSAGAIFIRRNPMAQLWSLIYLLCLHTWVFYILFSSHSQVSDGGTGNGAVFSLEVINKTSGS